MNICKFKVKEEGISFFEFSAQVNNDKDLINIYKAFDNNGDNKLTNDELASLLGAYKMFDNGDNSLSFIECNKFKKQIEAGLANDKNPSNDDVKIPASLAQKLDYANMMGDKDEQREAYIKKMSGS